jgi:hypothetical protein
VARKLGKVTLGLSRIRFEEKNGEVAMVGVELDGEVGSWWLGLGAGSNERRGSKIGYIETFGVG